MLDLEGILRRLLHNGVNELVHSCTVSLITPLCEP